MKLCNMKLLGKSITDLLAVDSRRFLLFHRAFNANGVCKTTWHVPDFRKLALLEEINIVE